MGQRNGALCVTETEHRNKRETKKTESRIKQRQRKQSQEIQREKPRNRQKRKQSPKIHVSDPDSGVFRIRIKGLIKIFKTFNWFKSSISQLKDIPVSFNLLLLTAKDIYKK